jgi:hypothetical protein
LRQYHDPPRQNKRSIEAVSVLQRESDHGVNAGNDEAARHRDISREDFKKVMEALKEAKEMAYQECNPVEGMQFEDTISLLAQAEGKV